MVDNLLVIIIISKRKNYGWPIFALYFQMQNQKETVFLENLIFVDKNKRFKTFEAFI